MSDPILLWNEVALEANRISHTNGQGEQTGPTLSSRALAIVHLAMYDAFAGVEQSPGLPQYIQTTPLPPPGANAAFAVAAAAHRTLSALFPSQKPFFDAMLAGAGSGNPADPAHVYGLEVADAILADRAGDPGAGSTTYKPSALRGHHRPDPENVQQGFHAPDYGRLSKGFAITDRWELAAPPFDNAEYETALREVRGKGIKPELMGTLPNTVAGRTIDETTIGLYWGYDGASEIGTPPRLYNQIVRRVAITGNNSPADNARLFAFVNVAMADAGILAWDQKYCHDFWRPVVGIREHDRSMGPGATLASSSMDTDCDPLWSPLGAPNSNRITKNFTPPFPAYPSGHATFGAAAFHITRLFYSQGGRFDEQTLGTDTLFDGLDFVSDELNGITTDNTGAPRPRHRRRFPDGLWRMIEENGRSRVYLGVHWVFDAFALNSNEEADLYRQDGGLPIGGVPLGLRIAEDIWDAGGEKAPKKSTVGPRETPCGPQAPTTETFSSSFLR